MVPSPEQYKKLSLPILTITGHYDGDQPGAFTFYKRHMQYGSAEAKASHYLIIGPWDHAGTRSPKTEMGGLKFAPASALDLNKLHDEWYAWTMKAGKKPGVPEKAGGLLRDGRRGMEIRRQFGKHQQRHAHVVPLVEWWSVRCVSFGDVAAKRSRSLPLRILGCTIHLDNRPGDAEPTENPSYLTSQSGITDLFGEGVIYHGDPFAAATEVSGFPKLTVWLVMDVPDTDLGATLYEILADGSSIFLSSATMRARYRESLREEKASPSGKGREVRFRQFHLLLEASRQRQPASAGDWKREYAIGGEELQ